MSRAGLVIGGERVRVFVVGGCVSVRCGRVSEEDAYPWPFLFEPADRGVPDGSEHEAEDDGGGGHDVVGEGDADRGEVGGDLADEDWDEGADE